MKDKKDLKDINHRLKPILIKYKRVTYIAYSILLVSGSFTILINHLYENNFLLGIAELITAFIGVCIFILILYFDKRLKKVKEIIKKEKETKKKILNKENHKLLPLGFKLKRNKINFIEENKSIQNN